MWPDNETKVDLLGFDFLVDELVVALTTSSLLPLTVGVLGEWGSGKSSLLEMTAAELDRSTEPKVLTVKFSPWQYEDYDDVKLALMRAVLDACEKLEGDSERIKGLKRFLRVVSGLGKSALRVGLRAAPAAAAATATVLDPNPDPGTAMIIAKTVGATADVLADELEASGDQPSDSAVTSLAEFRVKFEEMTNELPVDAVVVFIDDLDRCLPGSVVDTFEAIRLFLNTPKTAFVVGVHRQIAEAAIDAAFPEYRTASGAGLGHDYLEKMLQLQVSVPKPSLDDIEGYVGLLQARVHLPDDDYDQLCRDVSDRRHSSPFAPAFTAGIAAELLGEKFTIALKADLEWATQVVPAVSTARRANPRQIKRFLNDIRLRQGAARRRGIELEPPVLAKLQVLFETDLDAFQQLFDWQMASQGPAKELQAAESTPPQKATKEVVSAASGTSRKASGQAKLVAVDSTDPVLDWKARPTVQRWISIPPKLGAVDLRPYFSYFRSNLIVGRRLSTLNDSQRQLLNELTSDVDAVRRGAAEKFVALAPEEQSTIWEPIDEGLREKPDSPWWEAAGDISARSSAYATATMGIVGGMNDRLIPPSRVLGLIKRFPEGQGRDALLEKWAASPVASLSTIAKIAAKNTGT